MVVAAAAVVEVALTIVAGAGAVTAVAGCKSSSSGGSTGAGSSRSRRAVRQRRQRAVGQQAKRQRVGLAQGAVGRQHAALQVRAHVVDEARTRALERRVARHVLHDDGRADEAGRCVDGTKSVKRGGEL